MSRQIKFRGKASNMLYNGADILHHKGDWLYGDLIHQDGKCFIAPVDKRYPYGTSFLSFVVDAETVGQFTGLTDKNEVDIYEGDIISKDECHSVIMFGAFNTQGCILDDFIGFYSLCKSGCQNSIKYEIDKGYIVIGNRFDNSELLTDKD